MPQALPARCRARCTACSQTSPSSNTPSSTALHIKLHQHDAFDFHTLRNKSTLQRLGGSLDLLILEAVSAYVASQHSGQARATLHVLGVLPHVSWLLAYQHGDVSQHWARMADAASKLRRNFHFQQGELFMLVMGGSDVRVLGPEMSKALKASNLILACGPAALQHIDSRCLCGSVVFELSAAVALLA